jgi:D-tyrosyl-tRNA(Tyr) deacylase
MRILVQRVSRARVVVAGATVGEIGRGLLLFVGVTHDDTDGDAAFLASKIANLRIFDDADGNLNLSALDLLGGDPSCLAMLVVSQFTLYADSRKGRRPSFVRAAAPDRAAPLVDRVAAALRHLGVPVQTGQFGSEMAVDLVNDGPVTIWLDSSELRGDPTSGR